MPTIKMLVIIKLPPTLFLIPLVNKELAELLFILYCTLFYLILLFGRLCFEVLFRSRAKNKKRIESVFIVCDMKRERAFVTVKWADGTARPSPTEPSSAC